MREERRIIVVMVSFSQRLITHSARQIFSVENLPAYELGKVYICAYSFYDFFFVSALRVKEEGRVIVVMVFSFQRLATHFTRQEFNVENLPAYGVGKVYTCVYSFDDFFSCCTRRLKLKI